MTETTWRRVTGWAAAFVGALAVVLLFERFHWLVRPILATLSPFVIAFFIAFLMNPILERLERQRLARKCSLLLTILLFLALFAGAVLLWVPKVVEQGGELASNTPDYVSNITEGANSLVARAEPLLRRANLPTTLGGLVSKFSSQIQTFLTDALKSISAFVMDTVGKFTWLLIIPLVTIWLLMNWRAQGEKFQNILPDQHRDRIMHVLNSVGCVLNSYVRGMLLLALLYGVVTAAVLGFGFHMPYALVLGLVAGLVSPIPYIGSIVIMLSTGIMAYAVSSSLPYTGGVLLAMIVQNNIIFDNVIAPRVLGGSVGLSLPWSIFALLLGGSLFGIAGMVLAVPVGAAINVLLMELFPKLKGGEPEAKAEEIQPSEPEHH